LNGGSCNFDGKSYTCLCIGNFYGPSCSFERLNSTIFENSTILTQELSIELLNVINMPNNTEFKMLYQASRDGFGASDFHSKCNGITGTLVVVKDTNSNIFGGYTGADWSGYALKTDLNAFIFSLSNPFNISFRSNITHPQTAINPWYGPSFSYDLFVTDKSNAGNSSFYNFHSYYYQTPNFIKNATNRLGYYQFQTVEIEVYSVDRNYCFIKTIFLKFIYQIYLYSLLYKSLS
jgi:hypothetical protein